MGMWGVDELSAISLLTPPLPPVFPLFFLLTSMPLFFLFFRNIPFFTSFLCASVGPFLTSFCFSHEEEGEKETGGSGIRGNSQGGAGSVEKEAGTPDPP